MNTIMEPTQPKKRLNAKATRFESATISNSQQESQTGAFSDYQPNFTIEKPTLKLKLKSKVIEAEKKTAESISTELHSSYTIPNESHSKVTDNLENDKPTHDILNAIPQDQQNQAAISELSEEKQADQEESKGIYSRDFILKIIQEGRSNSSALPEFEFYSQRAQIEVQLTLKSNDNFKKGNRPQFKQKTTKPSDYNRPERPLADKNDTDIQRKQADPKQVDLKQDEPVFSWRQTISQEELEVRQKIEKSLNTWGKDIRSNKSPAEILQNQIRLQLNIITPENYEKVKQDIRKLALQSKEAIESVSELLIEKAWTETKYCKIYANLCEYLGKDAGLILENENGGKNYFKSYTLKRVQEVFDDDSLMKLKTQKAIEDMTKEEKEAYFLKRKKKILGNVTFIAELVVLKFMPAKVMIYCTNKLLTKYFAGLAELNNKENLRNLDMTNHEDHLDGLIQLYIIAGKIAEERVVSKDKLHGDTFIREVESACKNALKGNKDCAVTAQFNIEQLFKTLNGLIIKDLLSSRIVALIQNLEDIKNNNWKTPEFLNQGPKTIKEIHQEICDEEEEKQAQHKSSASYIPKNKSNKPYQTPQYNKKATLSSSIFKGSSQDFTIPADEIQEPSVLKKYNAPDMKPNRGNKNTSYQSTHISYEDCVVEMPKLFKAIEENDTAEVPEQAAASLLDKLARKSRGSEFVKVFMSTFSNGKQTIVRKRTDLLRICFDRKLINVDDFNEGFGEALYNLWQEASDFPGIEENFARILLIATELCGFRPNNLYIPPELQSNAEREYIIPTYLDVLKSAVSLAGKTENVNMDLKTLISKLECLM